MNMNSNFMRNFLHVIMKSINSIKLRALSELNMMTKLFLPTSLNLNPWVFPFEGNDNFITENAKESASLFWWVLRLFWVCSVFVELCLISISIPLCGHIIYESQMTQHYTDSITSSASIDCNNWIVYTYCSVVRSAGKHAGRQASKTISPYLLVLLEFKFKAEHLKNHGSQAFIVLYSNKSYKTCHNWHNLINSNLTWFAHNS